MGRYMRKSRRIVEVSVMEVTQGVGVRTRARTLALAAEEATAAPEKTVMISTEVRSKKMKTTEEQTGKMEMDYLQLRSRSLVMKQGFPQLEQKLDGKRREFVERGRISRCSSISSCEAGEEVEDDDVRFPLSGSQKTRMDLSSSICYFDCKQERVSGELESTAEREYRESTPRLNRVMPSASEIEEFFAAAEKSEKQRFGSKYNFDFDLEVPLSGQYDWVPINP